MLVNNRSGVGGRKPVVIPNPFHFVNVKSEICNALWEEDPKVTLNLIDLITGVVRAFSADAPYTKKQEYVNWVKVQRLYLQLPEFTRQEIQNHLRCSLSCAKKYVQVIKLCNMFIERSSILTNCIKEIQEFENGTDKL